MGDNSDGFHIRLLGHRYMRKPYAACGSVRRAQSNMARLRVHVCAHSQLDLW